MHKGDSCTLLSNAQPFNWKVLNAAGSESIMPSVCFLVPPLNKEAVDAVSRYVCLSGLSAGLMDSLGSSQQNGTTEQIRPVPYCYLADVASSGFGVNGRIVSGCSCLLGLWQISKGRWSLRGQVSNAWGLSVAHPPTPSARCCLC